jgi:hypothetical protein
MAALRSETMRDWEERAEEGVRPKRAAGETGRAAKDRARREKYLAREQAIDEAARVRAAQRAEKRAADDITQSVRDQARREAFFAGERAMVEAREARRAKV